MVDDSYLRVIYTNLYSFSGGLAGKESAFNAGELHLIPGLGRSPGERLLLQYCGLENFHGLYSPWGHKESDMIELLSLHFTSYRSSANRYPGKPLRVGGTLS